MSSQNLPADNYIITRDIGEAQRLDDQHRYMISCQGYYFHPDIELSADGTRVADICTGTAIFLREIAQAHPTLECHGFDISSKMFPSQERLPKNIELHIADIKQPFDRRWLGYFDVVHVRLIEAAMRKEEWGPTLRNVVTLLKPGGWLQWVEDDRAHSVRHAARPVARLGAAQESLTAGVGSDRSFPPRLSYLDRFNGLLMPNGRADDMTYAYMNMHTLMQDSEIGNLEHVGCDVYVVDREDDGGKLRKEWAAMGIAAVWSMLKSREDVGDKLTDLSRDELAEGFLKDIEMGAHFVTRVSVFTGRKR